MEAMLQGYKAVIASDISERAIADTGKNLEWIRKEFPSAKKTRVSVYVSPAEKIDALVKEPVDAIVTETYLGPPLRREANEAAVEKTISDLMHIYPASLLAMSRVLKPDGKMVIALPAFRVGKELRHVPVEVAATKAKFKVIDRFVYERAGQKVARDIVVMQKTALS
jgi:tRNA G10  N-methylase Trm11